MEIIRGKKTSFLNAYELKAMLSTVEAIHLDIGTGDGRYVHQVAGMHPTAFVIGVDACRENLVKISRTSPENALFAIANAETLPNALQEIASHVTINFPWGSLLQGLLEEDSSVVDSLLAVMSPNAASTVRLNGGALKEQGYEFEDGTHRVEHVLMRSGFKIKEATLLSAIELKAFPSTWAKRLAYGRDPRAMCLVGIKSATSKAILTAHELTTA